MTSTMMSTRSRRGAAMAALGVVAALALAACAPPGAAAPEDDPSEASATGTLKVGFISPTTGNFAVAGQEMVDGWNLYWETNGNEVNGVTVESMVKTDTGKPRTAPKNDDATMR